MPFIAVVGIVLWPIAFLGMVFVRPILLLLLLQILHALTANDAKLCTAQTPDRQADRPTDGQTNIWIDPQDKPLQKF